MPSPQTKSQNAPPAAPNVPASGGNQQSVLDDPFNLALQGYGDLRNQPLQGVGEFFNLPSQSYVPSSTAVKGPGGKKLPTQQGWPLSQHGTIVPRPYTATEAIHNFTLMTGAQLANVQDQLYRAGYYSANYVPDYGRLNAQDISAFRLMVIGLASNPSASTLGQFLGSAAQEGTQRGTSGATAKTIQLTNPDDLRIVLQKSAQQLYGGNLPETDVQKFIQTYQSMESSAQSAYADQQATKGFQAGEYNPATGHAQGATSGTATVVAAPNASAESEQFIRTQHPNQVAATEFGSAMDNMLAELRRPG